MKPTIILLLTSLLTLSACGRPDTAVPTTLSLPTPTVLASHDIANLLHNPPQPGTSVELDVYNWTGYQRQPGYELDSDTCPKLLSTSFLTDRPIPEAIHFPLGIQTNWIDDYPPESEAWLVPMFAGRIPPAPSKAYPPPTTVPYPRIFGHHLRVRGHLGEPLFTHCAHAERIFVIDDVIKVYEIVAPVEGVSLPADYAQWPLYAAPGQNYRIPVSKDWVVTAVTDVHTLSAAALTIPQWPHHPVEIRVFSSADAPQPPTANVIGSQFTMDFYRQALGLSRTNTGLTGTVIQSTIDAHTLNCIVTLTKNQKVYQLSMAYPIGINADHDQLLTFMAILARFEVA